MKAFFKQHRVAAYFVLAFALSWYPWILAILSGRTSGPNPLGPLIAAVVVTAIVSGRPGLREFFGRLVRWRVGWSWYALIFAIPILVCLAAGFLAICFVSQAQVAPLSSATMREIPERFIFILLFIGLGEEPGWRGFAQPQLETRYSPVVACLILAPIWALWHLPLMGTEFPWPIVTPFILSVFGGTFLLAWVFHGTKGSVLLPMLFHATVNSVGAGLIFPLFSGASLTLLWWIYGVVWLGAGLGLMLLCARSREPALPAGRIRPA